MLLGCSLRRMTVNSIGSCLGDGLNGLMFANLITFAHRSVSSTTSLWNSAGDIIKIGLPRFSSRALIVGSTSAAFTSRLSRVTISVGVFAGAPIPVHPPPT